LPGLTSWGEQQEQESGRLNFQRRLNLRGKGVFKSFRQELNNSKRNKCQRKGSYQKVENKKTRFRKDSGDCNP
jgi:hypothetical protein